MLLPLYYNNAQSDTPEKAQVACIYLTVGIMSHSLKLRGSSASIFSMIMHLGLGFYPQCPGLIHNVKCTPLDDNFNEEQNAKLINGRKGEVVESVVQRNCAECKISWF